MNCWHCKTELIWGGDHDIDHEDESYSMITNLSCPNCGSDVDVYLPKEWEGNGREIVKIKYTCKHCKNTQYISEFLTNLFTTIMPSFTLSCYVCTNPITRKDIEEQNE